MIVPLARSPDWRRPPVVTLALILLNVLVFFGLQLDDEQAEHEAFEYYFSTALPEIELPAYKRIPRPFPACGSIWTRKAAPSSSNWPG